MALTTQTIPIPLGGGLAQKGAEYLVENPSAQVAENVVFRKDGEVQKRPGFKDSPDPSSTSSRIAAHGTNDHLLYLSQTQTEILHATENTFKITPVPVGVTTAAEIVMQYSKTTSVTANNLSQDSASTDTFTLQAEGAYGHIFNHTTGELVSEFQFSGNVNGKAFSINNTHLCYAQPSANVVVNVFTIATLTWSTVTHVVAASLLDIAVCNANGSAPAAIVWTETTTAYFATFDGTAFGTIRTVDSSVHNSGRQSMAVCTHTNVNVSASSGHIIAYRDSSGSMSINSVTTAGSVGTPQIDIIANALFNANLKSNTSIIQSPYGEGVYGEVVLINTRTFGGLGDTEVEKNTYTRIADMASGVLESGVISPGTHAFTRLLLHPSGNYIMCALAARFNYNVNGTDDGETIQPFIISVLRLAEAPSEKYEWASVGVAGVYNQQLSQIGGSANAHAYNVNWEQIRPGVYRFSSIASILSKRRCEFHDIDFTPTLIPKFELDGVLFWGGGMLWQFDGTSTREAVSFGPPLVLGNTPSANDQTVTFIATQEWIDGAGKLHRSGVSNSLTDGFDIEGGNVTRIMMPPFTQLFGPVYRLVGEVVVYRTLEDGSTFYRHAGLSSGALTDYYFDSSSAFGKTDAVTESGTILYTHSELAASVLPAPYLLTVSENRIFLVPGEERSDVWYSKVFSDGLAPEFNGSLRIHIPVGGDITGIAVLDDKIVVFKSERTFVLYGQGYNNAGQGQNYAVQELNIGVGCIDPRSIVSGPFGVFFRASPGIYLLDRGLQATYVGAAVENELTSDIDITSAVYLPQEQEVRFTTNNDTILVFNALFQRWSIFTGIDAKDSTVFEGLHTILHSGSDPFIVQETREVFEDFNTTHIDYTYSTPWIKLTGLQGYQRIQRAELIFRDRDIEENSEDNSLTDITVKVYYDYNNSSSDSFSYSGADIVASGARGQLGIHIPNQKVESIRFEVAMEDSGSSFGYGLALVGLQIVAGVKRGMHKLPAVQMG